MKEIAIISAYAYIEHHVNYGSLLQYYALQTYLEHEGYHPYWIRYILPEEHSAEFKIKECIKLITSLYDRKRIKALNGQKEFIQKYIRLSDREYCGFDSIKKDPPRADLYITGSDQVWGGCIEANYLRFVLNRNIKMAYAASFGRSELSKEQIATVPDWIREINYVSLREVEGVKICKALNIPAIMVADPTMLIGKDDYPIVTPTNSADYFCYFLNKFSLDEEIEKLFDYSNTVFCGGINKYAKPYKDYEKILLPEEWIGMIKNSKYILTNSFHGMVFSIIFNKPFVVFLQNGMTGAQNSRIYSFLSYLGLGERIYKPGIQIDTILSKEINWDQASEKIDSLRYISFDFLHSALDKL